MNSTFADLSTPETIQGALVALRSDFNKIAHSLARVDELTSEQKPHRLVELQSSLAIANLKLEVVNVAQKLEQRKRDLARIQQLSGQLKREKTQ